MIRSFGSRLRKLESDHARQRQEAIAWLDRFLSTVDDPTLETWAGGVLDHNAYARDDAAARMQAYADQYADPFPYGIDMEDIRDGN